MRATSRQLWQATLFGGPAPALKRANRHEEQGVLNAVMTLLRTHPRVHWAARMNSGAFKYPDGRFVRFGFVGCSDIVGQMKDGRWLALECKAAGGKATAAQLAFLDMVREAGGCAGVVRSIDDALRLIDASH